MLIKDQLHQDIFSNSEKVIIDYIFEHIEDLDSLTTTKIAKDTYTNPSMLIRIAHKLGYDSWKKLKKDIISENEYLSSHFENIDANIPFTKKDNLLEIANKIATLQIETIKDTLSLITYDHLSKSVSLLSKAETIHMFASSSNLLIIREFKKRMNRIHRRVEIHDLHREILYDATMVKKDACAIIVSYSGESTELIQIAQILKKKRIPIIAITNISDNTLSSNADITLKMCTREKVYSKISTFSTDESVEYLLNVLYSCVFAKDYDKNWNLKINTAKEIEKGKHTTVDILKENNAD